MRAKKAAVLCIIGAAAMCFASGCSGTVKETEKVTEDSENRVETQAQSETESEPSTYFSAAGTFSIDLPDAAWTPSGEVTDGKWKFASADGSTLQIVHKKAPVGKKKLAKTPEKAQELLDKIKEGAFSAVEHQTGKAGDADMYYYGAQTSDTELGYAYYGRGVVNADTESYIITAKLSSSDASLTEAVKNSIASFRILKEDGGKADSGETTDENDASGDAGNDGSDDGQDGSSGDSGQSGGEESRYFFDEAGNTVYAYPSDDGAWRDENGMVYYFYEEGVEDKDGNWFYYDPPEYRDGASGSGADAGTDVSADAGQVADFYDKDGNYITATQDANGNWIGDDGKTYVLSDEGVTDSDGNFVPW